MKKLILFFITFFFFGFGINTTFAVIRSNEHFFYNGKKYYYVLSSSNTNLYDSETSQLLKTYSGIDSFDILYYDEGFKKFYFYKNNPQSYDFYYLNSDLTLTKFFTKSKTDLSCSNFFVLNGTPFCNLVPNLFGEPDYFYVNSYNNLPGFSLFGNSVFYRRDNGNVHILGYKNVDGNIEFYRYYFYAPYGFQSRNLYILNNKLFSTESLESGKINTFIYDFQTGEKIVNSENFEFFGKNYTLKYTYGNEYSLTTDSHSYNGQFSSNFLISNQICHRKDISFTSSHSFFDKDLTLKSFKETDNYKLLNFGEQGNNYEHSLMILNSQNLTGFNFENVKSKGNISFDPKNNIFRFIKYDPLDFYQEPEIIISSAEPIEWIKIDGTMPNGYTEFGRLFICGHGDIINGLPPIHLGKMYKLPLPSKDLCIRYRGLEYGTTTINIDFGTTTFKFHEVDVCKNDKNEIFINGDKFEGNESDLVDGVTPFDTDLKKEYENYLDKNNLQNIFKIDFSNSSSPFIITNGSSNNSPNEGDPCDVFSSSGTFLYYSDLNTNIDASSLSNYGSLFGFAGHVINVVLSPVNNFITILRVALPFTSDNTYVCLFGEVKKIQYQKLLIGTDYYGKMTFFDYLVLFALGISLFYVFVGFSLFNFTKINRKGQTSSVNNTVNTNININNK